MINPLKKHFPQLFFVQKEIIIARILKRNEELKRVMCVCVCVCVRELEREKRETRENKTQKTKFTYFCLINIYSIKNN